MIKKMVLNNITLEKIDKYGINGDFVESQAFGFLAIRSIMNLPFFFSQTITGCKKETTGGDIIKFK